MIYYVDDNSIIKYQGYSISLFYIPEKYKTYEQVEILPFIYLKKKKKNNFWLFKKQNNEYEITVDNKIDYFEIINKNHPRVYDNKYEYLNAVKSGSKHWVELNDIGYSYNLNCDLVKLFECKGFVINPDYENFAILTEYQVWKMTENNKKLFDSVCRKCYPCGSKINTLRDEWLYATSRNEDIKNPKQDIEVSLFDNRLTMAEGKHRICLCKRLNYKEILVSILPNGHSCQYKTKTLQPQEPLYYKKHPWYKVKDEFYKFYKEKLNLERDDLKEIYVDSKLEDFIINLEKLSNKDILEILQIEKN